MSDGAKGLLDPAQDLALSTKASLPSILCTVHPTGAQISNPLFIGDWTLAL